MLSNSSRLLGRALVPTLLTLCVVATGCQERIVAPLFGAGSYSLVSAATSPVILSRSPEKTVELLGATWRIDEMHAFVLDDTLRVTSSAGTVIEVEHRSGLSTEYARAMRLMPDQPGALWLTWANWEADGSVTMNHVEETGDVTLVFRRSASSAAGS